MKIAVFSDVHGNLEALEKVLGQIRKQNADKTIFLGDIFQRGNQEFECLELLKDSDVICLKGNCELYAQHGVDVDPDVEHLRAEAFEESPEEIAGDLASITHAGSQSS